MLLGDFLHGCLRLLCEKSTTKVRNIPCDICRFVPHRASLGEGNRNSMFGDRHGNKETPRLFGKLANQMDGCGGIAADGLNICIGNGFYGNFIFDFTSRRG